MIGLNIDPKWLIGLLAALFSGAALWLKIRSAKQQGRKEAEHDTLKLNLVNLSTWIKRREVIRGDYDKIKNCVPNDDAAVDKLSKESGVTTITGLSTSGMCRDLPSKPK